jgi:thiamine kinase-like enzyme
MAHQDIKPDNIGLCKNTAFLFDFEYSRKIASFLGYKEIINVWKNRSKTY